MTIAINPFVRRQTPSSRFSHFTGSEGDLLNCIEANLHRATPGYREGVILVPVPPRDFQAGGAFELKSGVPLRARFESRREGEDPRLTVGLDVGGNYEAFKRPAIAVDIVLYASTVLAEDGDNTLPAEPGNWEVISINARDREEAEPMHPDTLMANHFQEDGGTATGMTDSEFVAALRVSRAYWRNRVSLG